MRIISGKARGTKLYTLEGLNTRPTLDRVKESLFNILQNEILDCTFLDLFAGSGAIGLEAASRGAKQVILCEKQKDAIKIIEKNIEKTHMHEKVLFYPMDFEQVLQNKIEEKLDFVYLDPPYETDLVIKALKILQEKQYVDKNTVFIIETDQEEKTEKQLENLKFEIKEKRKYGRASILFIQKSKA